MALSTFIISSLVITLAQTQEIPPVNFRATEQRDSGSLVGNIPDSSNILQSIPFADQASVQYRFLDQSDVLTKRLFRISESSGSIYTNQVIDRETVCEFQTTCIISFDVAVQSSGSYFGIVTINVDIIDTNDNSPTFPENEVLIRIPEGVSIGSEYPVPVAYDPDTGVGNGVRSYSIIPESGAFSIRVAQSSDGSFDVKIVVAEILNRELEDSYRVFISAKDGGDPQNVGTIAVNISILDINDNKPTFTKETYNITVTENTSNSIVAIVKATDADIGDNAQLFFSIGSKASDDVKQTFTMNERSGEISVVSPLSYRSGAGYRIPVEVRDGGVTPLSSQAVVNINVLDTTNNAPVAHINLLSPGLTNVVNIPENSHVDAFVAHVRVEDSDTGSNGIVACDLNDNTFALSDVPGGRGYKVVVNGQLDRETKDSYNVTVTCQDQGSPPLQAIASFRVQLTDINDNPPQFSQNLYSTSLEENNDIGHIIALVSASDRDLGSNGDVTYKISGSQYSDMFTISSDGIITANDVFDRETVGHIRLTILACDSSCVPSSLTASATVTVDILDQNDSPPEFNGTVHVFQINENELSDFIVGTIHAIDRDAGTNGTVELFLPSTVPTDLPFVLFKNGVLKTNRELDREQQNRYDFNVQAKDMGQPPKYSITTITVIVVDENDNPPVILFPNQTNRTVTVEYLHTLNSPFTKIEAFDIDDGQNSVLTYSILNGNQNMFRINSDTGDISLVRHINIREDVTFELTVSVTDMGDHAHETQCSLVVQMLYKNITVPNLTGIGQGENSEGDKTTEEKVEVTNKNLIVILVVSIVTIIIAVAIVTIICFVRRGDRLRKQNHAENGKPGVLTVDGKENMAFHGSSDSVLDKKKERKVSFSIDTVLGTQGKMFNPPQYDNLTTGHILPAPMKPHLTTSSRLPLTNACCDMSMDDSTSDSGRGGSEDDMQINQKDDKLHMASRCRSPIYPLNGQLDLSFPQGFTPPILPNDSGVSSNASSYRRQPLIDDFQQNEVLRTHSNSPTRKFSDKHPPLRKNKPSTSSQNGLKPRAQFEQRRARTPDTGALRSRSNDDIVRSRTPNDILRTITPDSNIRPSFDSDFQRTAPKPALLKQYSLDSVPKQPLGHMTYLTDCDPNFTAPPPPVVQFKEHEFVKDLIV